MRKEFFRRAGQTAFIGGNHDAKRPLRPVVFESNAAERGVAAEKGFVGGLSGKTDSDAGADVARHDADARNADSRHDRAPQLHGFGEHEGLHARFVREGDEGLFEGLLKAAALPFYERMVVRRKEDERILSVRIKTQAAVEIAESRDADVRFAEGDDFRDAAAREQTLIDADVRILQKKAAQVVRKKRDGRVVVGGEPHDEPFVAAKGRHGVRHAGDLLKHLARLRRKTFARGGKRESPGESFDEVAPDLFLEVLEPDARGRGRDAALRRRPREVSRVGDRKKDAKIGEIDVLHGRLLVRDGRVVLFLGAQEGFKGKYTSVREWRTFG